MEISLSPETAARLGELAALRGCEPGEVVEDAMAGYFASQAETGSTLDRRYDEMMSGAVKMVSPEEFWTRFEHRKTEWLAKRR